MASLLHEVWEDEDGVSVFVSDGRPPQFVKNDARLVATFEASSWTEAMSKYYEMYDLGVYKPFASSPEPYSEELRAHQIAQLNATKIESV